MSPLWNAFQMFLVYVVVGFASYMMGRNDEQKKWAELHLKILRRIENYEVKDCGCLGRKRDKSSTPECML